MVGLRLTANHMRKRKSSKTSSIFSQATRLFGGVRVQHMASREKVPSSVGMDNRLAPEHEKNSMIMDTSRPLQLSRVGVNAQENMMIPIVSKCNSSDQAKDGEPHLRAETVDVESEVRYPSSTK